MPAKATLLLLFLSFFRFQGVAQTIHGEVLDMDNKKPLSGVDILNIYTMLNISTDEQGAFIIAATSGQLLEFKKPGYKTARVRIPHGYIPSYFRIIMKKGISDIKRDNAIAGRSNRYDYKADSIRFHELYKAELDFPKLTGLGVIQSPFSAMSRKNREIWQFQDDYTEFEKEKYVDRTFTEDVVTKFTGLQGDSLHYFMRRYRPSYEQLRAMNDYAFYNFVKGSVSRYRSYNTPRNSQ